MNRSAEAMEKERRDLERVKIHAPQKPQHFKQRNQARSDRFTNPSEALAALKASMRAKPGAPEQLYRCGVCHDSGWEEVSAEGRGTVRPCRRGCEVPQREEHKRKSAPEASGPVRIA